MKKVLLIFVIMLFSCSQRNETMTNKQIGNFILGERIVKEFDKKEFEITLDNNENIKSIISRSKLFKTKEGFGVGTDLNDIENRNNSKRKKLNISKGTVLIGNIGFSIVYDGIMFVDENNNGIVNFIWIQKE